MNIRSFVAVFCAFSLFACACHEEPAPAPEPELNISTPSSIELDLLNSSGTVSFTTNCDWTATTSESWLSVYPSSGTASDGPVTVTVSASPNETYDDRTATVTFTAGEISQTITVVQPAKLGMIVPQMAFELASDATSFDVEVHANVDYTVSISSSWIRQSGTKGLTAKQLHFVVDENTEYDPRVATIIIEPSAPDVIEEVITVLQAQRDAIIVDGQNYNMPYGGGGIEVKVSANVVYDVQSEVDWIQYMGTKGLSDSVIQLFVDENMNGSSREGRVNISQKDGSLKYTITVNQDGYVSVSEVSLDKTNLELVVGESATLTATVKPSDATNTAVSWSSDNTGVATVSSSGFVTAVGPGSAKITAMAGNKSASCNVTVENRVIDAVKTTEVPEEGGTIEVDIQYNADYDVVVDELAQGWLTYIQTRAVSSGKLQFLVAPNNHDDIRTGEVKIYDKAGYLEPVTINIRQASKVRRVLIEIYQAMGGSNWTYNTNWCTDEPLYTWYGVSWDFDTGLVGLTFRRSGLNGEIPDCIGELVSLRRLMLDHEPGITGSLPKSFAQLVNLEYLFIQMTSMENIPDVFADMKNLETVTINANEHITGPLPESLGRSDKLIELYVAHNSFTGGIPSSWVRWTGLMNICDNCLSGKVSPFAKNREDFREFLKKDNLWQKEGYAFDISDVDIPGFSSWIDEPVENTDGTLFTFDDVVKKSKYTVYVIWASWCPFSRTLMPAIKDYYQTYRQDGLEIIGTSQVGGVDDEGVGHMMADKTGYLSEVISKGYDQWYNFYWPDYGNSYLMTTPNAEVYDSDGNVLFSSFDLYPDPVRNRYSKVASTELIPFLETLFGPATAPDPYTSTDYSKDGQVLTLQKATVGKGINIVFMGDAYTDKDMGSGGVYETVMKQAMEEFFAEEPYKTFRNRFNVYAVKVVSKNGRIGPDYQTALGTYFGSGTYVAGDDDKCFEYAMKVPGISSKKDLLVGVLVNSNRNFGTAILYADNQCAVARVPSFGNDPEAFGSTLQHEAGGHGFAFLADEYATNAGTPPQDFVKYYNEVYNQYGWFSNVDFTDDPSKIRWSAFLSDERYNGQVGIYEGGALYTQGAWRPTANSIMKDNYGHFNAPSRWAIYQQIMKRSGEDYSWEKFVEYDAVNRSAPVQAPLKAPDGRHHEPGAPPVIRK
ncbi:MAG: Ig-like domain-containing protein [Bacteroidales bacterium]|nr:Ig-like domain-containing protein [Bacteroidales bacterium]